MSEYEQTALVVTEMERTRGEAALVATFEHLVEHHDLDPYLEGSVARLDFDETTNVWARTIAVDADRSSLKQLIAEYRWLRMSGYIRLGDKRYGSELYYYPANKPGDWVGLILRLEAGAYRAVYGGRPAYDRLFSEEARSALIALCLGTADACDCDGFLYEFDTGNLPRLTVEQLRQRLLTPNFDVDRGGPGLIAGIRNSIVPKTELDAVWGAENVKETTTGYVFVALLLREE